MLTKGSKKTVGSISNVDVADDAEHSGQRRGDKRKGVGVANKTMEHAY